MTLTKLLRRFRIRPIHRCPPKLKTGSCTLTPPNIFLATPLLWFSDICQTFRFILKQNKGLSSFTLERHPCALHQQNYFMV